MKWTILAVTTLSPFMTNFDSNVVSIALPTIGHQFSSGISLLGWVVSAYVLAVAVTLLQAGKIGDRYGKKKTYLTGFALFGICSALCGVSQSAYQLIAFRALQGISATFMGATSGPLVYESFPPKQRGTALGINSIAWGLGSVAGPVLGGFLVGIDWRLIFYINIPIAAAGVMIGRRVIPQRLDQRVEATTAGRANPMNSVLFGLSVAGIFISLTFFNLYLAVLGAIGMTTFAFLEMRSSNPLLSKELMRERGYILSLVSFLGLQMGGLAVPFTLSFYLQVVAGYSPALTGLWIAPYPISYVLASPFAGRIYDRLRVPAMFSMLTAAVSGMALILLAVVIGGGVNPSLMTLLLAVFGPGYALVYIATIASLYSFARPSVRSVASSTALTFSNVGFAASIALVTVLSTSLLPQDIASQIRLGNFQSLTTPNVGLFNGGIELSLIVQGALFLVIIPVLFLLAKEQKKKASA